MKRSLFSHFGLHSVNRLVRRSHTQPREKLLTSPLPHHFWLFDVRRRGRFVLHLCRRGLLSLRRTGGREF